MKETKKENNIIKHKENGERIKNKKQQLFKNRKKRLLPTVKEKVVYKEYEKKKAHREKCI